MAKGSGGTKLSGPKRYRTETYKEYRKELESGSYDRERSKFFGKAGGYVLTYENRKRDNDEQEVAEAMAKAGYCIKLTPEGKIEFSTGVSSKGNPVYADGLINGLTFEQATKNPVKDTKESLINAIDGALKHAYDKRSRVPVIYDKFARFHKEHIERGLNKFESHLNYRFEAIIVVDSNKNVWIHKHNAI